MKKVNNIIKTTTYIRKYHGITFLVDIIEKSDIFDLWITTEDYGIKSYMFGLPKEQSEPHGKTTAKEAYIIMLNNFEDYADMFIDDYPEILDWR